MSYHDDLTKRLREYIQLIENHSLLVFITDDGYKLYRHPDHIWRQIPIDSDPDLNDMEFDDKDGHPVDDTSEPLSGHFEGFSGNQVVPSEWYDEPHDDDSTLH